jgi:uncharacterized protein
VRISVADERRGEVRPGWPPVVVVVGSLAVSNVMTNRVLPSALYVPWNLAMVAALLVVALGVDRCELGDLGLGRDAVGRGLAHGGIVFGAVLGVYLVGLAIPATRDLFDDERVRDTSFWEMAYQVVVRIPFGTVLLEEVAFRGVLLGMLLLRTTVAWAVFWSSLGFGLWHVLPGLGVENQNPVLDDIFGPGAGAVLAVGAAVVGTAAAGYVLCWLRLRSRSLIAPLMLHVATNSLGFFVAWWYLRLR